MKFNKKHLLASCLSMGILLSQQTATASCIPDPVSDNDVVTCTLSHTTQVGSGFELDVTVNLLPGSDITVGFFEIGINLSEGSVINNEGSISSPTSDAIVIENGNVGSTTTITNLGTGIINGNNHGILIDAIDNATITNTGSITGGIGNGVNFGSGGGGGFPPVVFRPFSSNVDERLMDMGGGIPLESPSPGGENEFHMGEMANNAGPLSSGAGLICLTITNNAGASITGTDGVNFSGSSSNQVIVDNAGSISGTSGAGIIGDGSDQSTDFFRLTNSGAGAVSAAGFGGSSAIELTDFGEYTFTQTGTAGITSPSGVGLNIAGRSDGSTLTINNAAGTSIIADSEAVFATDITVLDIDNAGTIRSNTSGDAIEISSGFAGSVANFDNLAGGIIQSTEGNGAFLENFETYTVNNAGIIRSGGTTPADNLHGINLTSNIANSVATITNTGTIETPLTTSAGVEGAILTQDIDTVTINNESTGVLDTNKGMSETIAANTMNSTLTTFNNNGGTVSSVYTAGGALSFAAALIGGDHGNFVVNNTGSMTVSGATTNIGVYSFDNSALTLTNGTAVGGTSSGIISSTNIGVGISQAAGIISTITNYGTIRGTNSSINATTSTTLTGTFGQASVENVNNFEILDGAVLLGAGDDTLVIDYDGDGVADVINGIMDGGADDDTLRYQGENLAPKVLDGADHLNWESLEVINDSDLNFTGTHSFVTSIDVNNGGSAGVAGATFTTSTFTNAADVHFDNDGPSGTIGTATISGDYVQTAAGTLSLELGSGPTDHDVLVANNATLSGTLVVTATGGPYNVGDVFDIIQTGGAVSGAFTVETLPSINNFAITYEPTLVRLIVLPSPAAAAALDCAGLENRNNIRVCEALAASTSSDQTTLVNTLAGLSLADRKDALRQLHAETYFGTVAASLNLSERHEEFIRLRQQRMYIDAPYAKTNDHIWGYVQYGHDRYDDNDQVMENKHDYVLVQIGADHYMDDPWFNGELLLGASLGHAQGELDYDRVDATIDTAYTTASAYGNARYGDWTVGMRVGAGVIDAEHTRNIKFADIDEVVTSSYSQYMASGHAEVQYEYKITDAWSLKPHLGSGYIYLHSDDIVEEGRSDMALRIHGQHHESLNTTAALAVETSYKIDEDHILTASLKPAYQHDFIDDHLVSAGFQADLANTGFVSEGNRGKDGKFMIDADIVLKNNNGCSVYFNYHHENDFGEHQAHTAHLGASLRF